MHAPLYVSILYLENDRFGLKIINNQGVRMENLNLVTGIGKLQLRKQGIVGYFEIATL